MSPTLRVLFILLALSNAFGFAISSSLWPQKCWNPLRDILLGLPVTVAAVLFAILIERWL